MGKKMKLLFLSNQTDHQSRSGNSWPWPSCTQTRTLSFRTSNDIFKTMNSTFSDTSTTTTNAIDEPRHYSLFTNSSSSHETDGIDQSACFSTASEDQSGVDPVEAVIQGLRSERLFFEPGETSSILEETHKLEEEEAVPFKESVALSFESKNPYLDFKKSMVEMVEAHDIKGWEGIEELLCWYLKMNSKDNHGYIVGAFVDLLVGLAFYNNSNTSNTSTNNSKPCKCSNCDSPYSPLSFCNTSSSSSMSSSSTPNCVSSLIGVVSDQEIETPCLSSLLETEEEDEDVSS